MHCFDIWLWQVLCELRKNKKLKRMYQFKGRVACRNWYYISKKMYGTSLWILYIEGRIARRDEYHISRTYRTPRWMHEQICSPWVLDCETARVYIIRLDMNHYTWHCISLHCTSLSLMNLILWVPLCESCDWGIMIFYWGYIIFCKCCCWNVCYVYYEQLGWIGCI